MEGFHGIELGSCEATAPVLTRLSGCTVSNTVYSVPPSLPPPSTKWRGGSGEESPAQVHLQRFWPLCQVCQAAAVGLKLNCISLKPAPTPLMHVSATDAGRYAVGQFFFPMRIRFFFFEFRLPASRRIGVLTQSLSLLSLLHFFLLFLLLPLLSLLSFHFDHHAAVASLRCSAAAAAASRLCHRRLGLCSVIPFRRLPHLQLRPQSAKIFGPRLCI
ncbi:hypothetical protein J3E69DRAFT_193202 [Trichoderma sp. SZMC 28015]